MTWARCRSLGPLRASVRSALPRAQQCIPRGPVGQYRSLVNASGAKTDVERIILDTIKATGPISHATYMQMCLSHPTAGYYMRSDSVIGARGDFITSPEISQVFGELLGIWFLSQWLHSGNGRPIRVVELGPGRGTLMHDILRTLSHFPSSKSATKEVCLVENSDAMRAAQDAKLSPLRQSNEWRLNWHGSIEDIPPDPDKFTFVVAHEFFDALPFHLLQRTDKGWQEVLVDASPDPAAKTVLKPASRSPLDFVTTTSPARNTSPDLPQSSASHIPLVDSRPTFRQVLAPTPTASSTVLGLSSPRFAQLPLGARVEISPAAFKIAHRVGSLLSNSVSGRPESAGSALIVDYGGDHAYGGSFRGFKDHKIVDVFHRPGECDLTVNVDFAYLKEATADLAQAHGPLPQATFLNRMGLEARVNALTASASSKDRKGDIENAAKRLVDLTGMGKQYQVMALTGKREKELTPEEKWPFVDS